MPSPFRIVGACIALILVFILGAAWWWRDANVRTRLILLKAKKSLERDAIENLPPGSTKLEVERFLKSRNMIYANGELPYMPEAESKTQAVSQIEARTTQEIRVPIGSCFILADFDFDPNEKLLDARYKTTCKGIL